MEKSIIKPLIKSEDNRNIFQSLIDTFNKEIAENDATPSDKDTDTTLHSINGNSTFEVPIITGSTKLTNNIENQEEIVVTENAPTYFVDEQGRYYIHADSHQQVISSVGNILNGDDEILLAEDTNNDILVDPANGFQAVAIDGGGELSYVFIVQQSEDKVENVNSINDIDNNLKVYDFNENDPDDSNPNIELIEEEDKVKPKKSSQFVPKSHICNYCTYTTTKKYLLLRHLKSHSEERPHKCTVCLRGFKTLSSLQNHINTHTGTKPHNCRYCDSAFTTSGELVRHVRYRHTLEKPHRCSECEYASVELSKLKRHARCHTGERPYQCPHCTYASPDTFKLKRHLRTHTGEKPYECEYCHMCFSQSNSLKAHKLRHNIASKPVFHCQLCPTTCGRKTDLRIHVQKLHTADKSLKCRRCGKSFPDRYSFKVHNKTHNGEKCFKCDMCPYASVSMRHLTSHMLIHTDEKPYACASCDQTFRQKQLLRRHENLYHNPEYVPPMPQTKSEECVECGKQFRHKGNLIRHMAVHDPDSSVHERSIALKIGRQRKISVELVNAQNSNNNSEYGEENMSNNEIEMNSDKMPPYVVVEVIQVPEENSNDSVGILSSENHITEKSNKNRVLKHKTVIINEKQIINTEKDVENCFGFDVDDAEDELNDSNINLY